MPTHPTRAQRAAAKKKRLQLEARREDMLDDIASGIDYLVVAAKNEVSVKTVRREVERALDARWMAAPQRYVRLQVTRLNRALRAVDDALQDGEVAAVEPLIRLLDKLDRYHALAALAAPAPSGTKKGKQVLEITQGSHVLAPEPEHSPQAFTSPA